MRITRLMRRNANIAKALLALLSLSAVLVAVHGVPLHDHDGGGGTDAIVLCIVIAGGVVAVVATATAIRQVARQPLWLVATPALPVGPSIAAPRFVLARAGPPPLLQVFRL
jgi:hypothetical protein